MTPSSDGLTCVVDLFADEPRFVEGRWTWSQLARSRRGRELVERLFGRGVPPEGDGQR